MVQLPVLTELNVTNYEMFPGDPPGSGLRWSFHEGVTVVAGINGLGKTTLLTMILRAFTGRYDLTGEGASALLGVTLPERPVRLNRPHIQLFQYRVSDGAANAKVELSTQIGDNVFCITRRLDNLVLESMAIDGTPVSLPRGADARETLFQSTITGLIGLSSFVDVLLVLHYVILFYENRPGALWDTDAQRHLLRAMSLTPEDATHFADLERRLQKADSQARNVHARITRTEKRLHRALQLEAGAERVLAELSAEQELLDADLQNAARLEAVLEDFDEQRRTARRAHQRAKIEREQADGAIERLKYAALITHFPSMDQTTRLTLSRIMADGICIACESPAEERQAQLEQQVSQGLCPICGSRPKTEDGLVTGLEFDQARLTRELDRAARAKREETLQGEQSATHDRAYREALVEWENLQQCIHERTKRNRKLKRQLPDSVTVNQYRSELDSLRADHNHWQAERGSRLEELRQLLAERREEITARSGQLIAEFSRIVETLLVEDVRLVQIQHRPRYLEAPGPTDQQLEVPAYGADMASPARPELSRRDNPSKVSESQRELIDLAFRLALVSVFGGTSTFVMETPEASLDAIAMDRVGNALAEFATSPGNCLLITTNLTNAGVISSIFQATEPHSAPTQRLQRVINLLQVALPNRALLQDRSQYEALLRDAIDTPSS